jgi:hypothetical protein
VLFYLGTDRLTWLWSPQFAGVPLFVSHRQMRTRRSRFPRAVTDYAVDSGAYTELTRNGGWVETPEQYVAALRRYADELGPFRFAAQQDWLCSPDTFAAIKAATGRRSTVTEHQERTVENYLRLRDLAPDLPIAPSLQGVTYDDYLTHAAMFGAAGVDLAALPVVGVGSIVRHGPAAIERLTTGLNQAGIRRLHGFGVKAQGLAAAAHGLASADSMAWSFAGRMTPLPGCSHRSCAHCPRWALLWRDRVLAAAAGPQQMGLAF